MNNITPNLLYIQDTCSVYAVTAGGQVLLIDCGTDMTPTAETFVGRKMEKILLTHFHRDQCSSASAWQRSGAKIVVPFGERQFLEESDLRRASYDIYDNYDSYYPCFGPLRDVMADEYAHDYRSIYWRDLEFQVVPLPGHTFGSAGYLFTIDGKRVLACGDLLSAPDRIHNYFSFQWQYMSFQGHSHLLDSLKAIEALDVDLILPGHGEPFEPDAAATSRLRERFERLYEMFFGHHYQSFEPSFRWITEHVIEILNASARTYIILDGTGKAVFIDCGYVSNEPIAANPHRFIDNITPRLKSELGIQEVEWFLPTHYHDDHLAGYPALKGKYGTQVVSSPELKDIFEHPERFDMPCAVPDGMPIERVVARGEAFEWRGIEFFIEQHPGQTLYHHLIRFEADGKRFLAIGDNISGNSLKAGRELIHSFIPKNRTPVSSYTDMPQQILDASPDFLLTGHCGALEFNRQQVERWQEWMDEWQRHFTEIIDQPHPNMGMDPHWVEFYPFNVRIRPGEEVTFRINITNHEPERRRCELRYRSVDGVSLKPAAETLEVGGNSLATCELNASFPDTFNTHSLTILADVTWNGRHLGEIAEAVAYW